MKNFNFHNSLLVDRPTVTSIAVDIDKIQSPTVFKKESPSKKMKTHRLKLFRKETASAAITDFSKTMGIFGFSKGQFSLIELIEAVLEKTGPAHLTVSTWTAAKADLNDALDFLNSGRILSARFLLDFSFQRRQPEVAKRIRDVFGKEALRITRNHAKFFLVKARGWTVSCKTSMNLNRNPRFEDFDLSNDKGIFNFLDGIVNDLYSQTCIEKQEKMTIPELCKEFQNG